MVNELLSIEYKNLSWNNQIMKLFLYEQILTLYSSFSEIFMMFVCIKIQVQSLWCVCYS